MKKALLLACLCGVLFACESVEEKAGRKLDAAREAFAQGNFGEAKLLIDTIKVLYPKAFEARRAGIYLMQEVELAEQEKTLAYLDSLLADRETLLASMKGKFAFEKDAEYQQIGNYIHPSQILEKNLHRSYLCFRVNERGEISTTSIYCGTKFLHHHSVKVVAGDSYAETPTSRYRYETTVLGEKIEKAEFAAGEDGDIPLFICEAKDKELKVEYVGDTPYSYTMKASDRLAATSICELTQVLKAITDIRKEMEEANLKIRFIKKKMEERAEKEQDMESFH